MILVIRTLSLFKNKAKLAIRGRTAVLDFPPKTGKRIIVHCASLGEYEQAKPIIEHCMESEIEVILTFFSPSGYEMVKDSNKASIVCYLPFDLPKKVAKFIDKVKPDMMVFIKYEFWWNFIRSGIPIIFASVVLRNDHYLFKWWARSFLAELKKVDAIFLIDQNSADILSAHDFSNHHLAGDTRVESVLSRKNASIEDEVIKAFCGDANVFIFGSTYPIEHNEIIRMVDSIDEEVKVLIFPHEIDHKAIFSFKERLGKDCVIYSKWKDNPVFHGHQLMIVDKVGLLKDAYRHANLAYIGGGFAKGIHNILEPFVYKIPLVFGPNFKSFPEANLLSKQDFVVVIYDVTDLGNAIVKLKQGGYASAIDDIYSFIFEQNGHASVQIVEHIKKELWKQ